MYPTNPEGMVRYPRSAMVDRRCGSVGTKVETILIPHISNWCTPTIRAARNVLTASLRNSGKLFSDLRRVISLAIVRVAVAEKSHDATPNRVEGTTWRHRCTTSELAFEVIDRCIGVPNVYVETATTEILLVAFYSANIANGNRALL